VCDDVYGGTGRLFRRLFAKYNLDFQFIDMANMDEVKKAATANTKLIWVESPTNPTMKVIDIQAMSAVAKSVGAKLVVDNTFASPVFQSPLLMGADIVMHSSTKYIGGHSDMIGGALMMTDKALHEQLKFVQFAAGAVPSPFESFMFLRSIKTLAVRMEQHAKNAQAVAEFLEKHPKAKRVYFPGLKSHPQHELAKKQMSGFSGMVSFDMNGTYDDVVKFLKKLKVFCLAESLGGVESLVNHPEKMTHASVPEELRKKLGIGPTLLRLSVGIEDTADLIADLDQALS
jgi:cystathionine beta-lyase/cystathionine gamma-synthase